MMAVTIDASLRWTSFFVNVVPIGVNRTLRAHECSLACGIG